MAERFDPKLEADIVIAYRKGAGGKELARRFGISSSSVYRVVRRHGGEVRGWSPNPNKFSPDQEAEIARHYADGRLSSSIARTFGCSQGLVRAIARRHGVLTREHGGQKRRWTDEQRADMERRYLLGATQAEIAGIYNTSQIGVSRILRARDVTRRRGRGRWKGGRVNLGGYVGVMVENDSPFACMRVTGNYVLEHRLVMAQHLGRPLTKHETVHHINGDKLDNRLENLQLRQGRHGKGEVLACADCGSRHIIHVPLAD